MIPAPDNAVVVALDTRAGDTHGLPGFLSARAYIEHPRFEVGNIVVVVGSEDALHFQKHGRDGGGIDDARVFLQEQARRGAWLVAHEVALVGLLLERDWHVGFKGVFETAAYLRFLAMDPSLDNAAATLGVPLGGTAPSNLLAEVAVVRGLFEMAVADDRFGDLEWFLVDAACQSNIKGLPLDLTRARDLAGHFAAMKLANTAELARKFPMFDLGQVSNDGAVKRFVKSQFALDLKTVSRNNIDVVEARLDNLALDAFLSVRDTVMAHTRLSQLAARLADAPARVHNFLCYCGSRTGRYTSGGTHADGVNLHGLPRAEDVNGGGQLRGVIASGPEESMVACDLVTFEPRVLAFLAQEHALLRLYRDGADVYAWLAEKVFPGMVIKKGGPNAELRQVCKEAVIGLGYGMGLETFMIRVLTAQPTLSLDHVAAVFDGFRNFCPSIGNLRRHYWQAFRAAVELGECNEVGFCRFERLEAPAATGCTIQVTLPSGRPLFYQSVRAVEPPPDKPWQWHCTYVVQSRFDGPGEERDDIRVHKLTQNIVEGVARDIVCAQMRELQENHGLRTIFNVHDSIVVACARCTCNCAEDSQAGPCHHDVDCPWAKTRGAVEKVMSRVPRTLPELAGLPLACKVSAVTRDRYVD
jgi:hypothetical protein